MGYYGPRLKAPKPVFTSLSVDTRRELVELAMASLRREIESVDCYQGSVVMHSLGGGTGSGLGCRMLENIRDTYPKAYIVTASVAPSWTRGDTPLQNYNAVLTLRCLQEVADAVIYKDNDELLRTAGYWKTVVQEKVGSDSINRRVSLAEINAMTAADLAGLLFPIASGGANTARPFDFGKLLHDVCPMPATKILDVRSGVWRDRVGSGIRSKLPSNGSAKGISSATLIHAPTVAQTRSLSLGQERAADFDTSLDLVKTLVQQVAGSFPRSLYATMASSTIVRGFNPAASEIGRFSDKLGGIVQTSFPPVPWLAGTSPAMLTYSSPEPFSSLQAKASATICVNNGNFLVSTKKFLGRAQLQFASRAYVHWYKQHGMEDTDFKDAFDKCSALISEYETILR
ncbi:Cryptic tubulin [Phytophthora megakarya]|uniref:Tubulin delta chain n=1 Tax=Phytophthora megakarya TaxID=4795 RepID=A0A225X5E6_9STRA|nr:Cryptic tubulin [Phytophthora megakarya]